MDISPQQKNLLHRRIKSGVSILVLMDISPQPNISFSMRSTRLCFNPCFNGYFSSTRFGSAVPPAFSLVSILVLMDISPQQYFGKEYEYDYDPVSILVLMDISPQHSGCVARKAGEWVSILVLMDISPQLKTVPFRSLYRKFQSLF